MNFGTRLVALRKEKKISQAELASSVGLHSNALGRYERGEAVPSVEVAAKIASELGASLDALIGLSEIGVDDDLMSRYKEITSLSDEDRKQLYSVIDALLRDYKAKAKK